MSTGKFSDKAINVRIPRGMREAIDRWGEVEEENISVIIREALRVGLVKLGVMESPNGRINKNNT